MISDFDSVLHAAQALPEQDLVRLIDVLWDSVPADAAIPLPRAWEAELQQRVASLQAGTAKSIPWSTIREAALARIGHGTIN